MAGLHNAQPVSHQPWSDPSQMHLLENRGPVGKYLRRFLRSTRKRTVRGLQFRQSPLRPARRHEMILHRWQYCLVLIALEVGELAGVGWLCPRRWRGRRIERFRSHRKKRTLHFTRDGKLDVLVKGLETGGDAAVARRGLKGAEN